jgi:hypothetical protein
MADPFSHKVAHLHTINDTKILGKRYSNISREEEIFATLA